MQISVYLFIHFSIRLLTYPPFHLSSAYGGSHEAHPVGYSEEQQLPAELHVSHDCTGPVIVAIGLVTFVMAGVPEGILSVDDLAIFDDFFPYIEVPFANAPSNQRGNFFRPRSTQFCLEARQWREPLDSRVPKFQIEKQVHITHYVYTVSDHA